MKSLKQILRKHGFFLCIFLTLFSAYFLRTYNLANRIGLGSDSTRDVIIAQEALRRHELPLIGSFSSAGPFVFGPLYFWFNMAALTIMPFSFKTPWILMGIVGLLTVVVMMITGYRIGGKRLCILLGLLTAFCPQFVSRSTGLTQHSLVGITTALLLLFFILFYQTKKLRYAFLMGISVGTALSMHYQALNLLIFMPAILAVPKINFKRKVISLIFMSIGFIIPSFPLFYWDSQQSFTNYRNVLDYIFIGQYRIYVANSWKIYLFKFLPDYWSNVVGGNKPVTAVIMVITFFSFAISVLKRRLQGEVFTLGIIFAILLVIIRYYRGERFDGYVIYIAPFIFLLSGWALLTMYNMLKKLSVIKEFKKGPKLLTIFSLILFAIIIVSDLKNASQFIFVKNYQEIEVLTAKNALVSKYPHEQFQLYDYYWKSSDYSYALGEFLSQENRISNVGIPIGIKQIDSCAIKPPVYSNGNWEMITLGQAPRKDLVAEGWVPVNPNDVYDDLITRWTKNQKLTSSFSLSEFILNKLHKR